MREIRYRPRATFDLESIVVYLGEVQKSPASAQRIYQSVQEAIALLGDMPTLGKPFSDDSLDRKNYRSYLAGSYRVFYTFGEESLTVWRVVHTRQDIDDYAFVDWE